MTTKIRLYDANSWIRRLIEADPTGLPLRTIMTEVNTSPAVEIFVWDGAGGNDRRRKLYPEYKMNRGPVGETIWDTLNLTKDMLRHTKAIQITVNGYEGDDVVAALCAAYATKAEIEILSTDRDLCALCALPGVSHFAGDLTKIPFGDIRLYKATVGDPSDNIPGWKGFGKGGWEKANHDRILGWFLGGCPEIKADAEATAEVFGIGKGVANWLIANQKLAQTFWDIVGFFPPTNEELERCTVVGKRDDAAAVSLLKRFLQ